MATVVRRSSWIVPLEGGDLPTLLAGGRRDLLGARGVRFHGAREAVNSRGDLPDRPADGLHLLERAHGALPDRAERLGSPAREFHALFDLGAALPHRGEGSVRLLAKGAHDPGDLAGGVRRAAGEVPDLVGDNRNPRPCSPACAAMIAALRASRPVCSVTSSMTPVTAAISPTRRASSEIAAAAAATPSRIRSMPARVLATASFPAAASVATRSARDVVALRFRSISRTVKSISVMLAEEASSACVRSWVAPLVRSRAAPARSMAMALAVAALLELRDLFVDRRYLQHLRADRGATFRGRRRQSAEHLLDLQQFLPHPVEKARGPVDDLALAIDVCQELVRRLPGLVGVGHEGLDAFRSPGAGSPGAGRSGR